MARRKTRVLWNGEYYFRKLSRTWRNRHDGSIVRAPPTTKRKILRRKSLTTKKFEYDYNHSFGGEDLARKRSKISIPRQRAIRQRKLRRLI